MSDSSPRHLHRKYFLTIFHYEKGIKITLLQPHQNLPMIVVQ
jgi:hypothetical protein